MRFYRVTALLLGVFSVTVASAAQIVLYDGTSSPTAQGWQQSSVPGGGTIATQVESDGTTRFTTTTAPGAKTGPTNIYDYTTGASNYIASIRLNVLASTFNPLDAGLMFTTPGDGTNSLPVLNLTGRSNMVTINNGRVQWGDLNGSADVTANDFHEYAIRFQNGKLDVYVDATYADIRSGIATPLLTRTPAAFTNPGVLVFGDQTNDTTIDSDYYVDFVKFQDLDVAAPTLAVTSSGSSSYGGSVSFTATLTGAANPTGTVTFCADDATCAAPSWSCTVPVNGTSGACSTAILAAGNHSVTASYTGDAHNDPAITTAPLTQIVAPAELTITANDASATYGATLPTFSATYAGFVNGERAANLAALPTFSTTATSTSPVGTYSIVPAGAVAANYSISYVDGTLTISRAGSALNLTPPASLGVGSSGTVTATSTATSSTQSIVINSATPGMCSLSNISASATQASATVRGLGAGTCTLVANQAGDASYTAQSASADVVVAIAATTAIPTPALSPWMLILLGLILTVAGACRALGSKRV